MAADKDYILLYLLWSPNSTQDVKKKGR